MFVLDSLWQLTGGVQVLFALRIWSLGLSSRYPVTTSYLVISPILITVGTVFRAMNDPGTPNLIHGWFWVLTRPLAWIVPFMVIVEIHQGILDRFSGFKSLGQLVMKVATGLLAVLYLLTATNQSLPLWRDFWLHQQQVLFVVLTLLCIVVIGFAAYWELPISRNIWLLIVPFTLMIGGTAFFTSLSHLLDADSIETLRSVVMPLVNILTFGTGALLFSKAGENTRPHTARPNAPEVFGQLETMNNALIRVLLR